MLETTPASTEALVRELDILIRARYPLISVTTFEEGRFRRLMEAVAQLEKHRSKGLFVWSRSEVEEDTRLLSRSRTGAP